MPVYPLNAEQDALFLQLTVSTLGYITTISLNYRNSDHPPFYLTCFRTPFTFAPLPKSLPTASIINDQLFKHALQVPTFISSSLPYRCFLDKPRVTEILFSCSLTCHILMVRPSCMSFPLFRKTCSHSLLQPKKSLTSFRPLPLSGRLSLLCRQVQVLFFIVPCNSSKLLIRIYLILR